MKQISETLKMYFLWKVMPSDEDSEKDNPDILKRWDWSNIQSDCQLIQINNNDEFMTSKHRLEMLQNLPSCIDFTKHKIFLVETVK